MAAWKLEIGSWAYCTLDGVTECKGQICRIISDDVVDINIINDSGHLVQGVTEAQRAIGLDRSKPMLWWPA